MPALKEDVPETMVSLAAMTDMMRLAQEAHADEKLRMQRDFAQRLDRATQTARSDAMAEQRRRAFASHAEGRFEAIPLVNDPYDDVSATLAEVRTNTFALKLVCDDQDGEYRLTGSVRARVHATSHKIVKAFETFEEATAAYNRIAARFGGILTPFRTQVDY